MIGIAGYCARMHTKAENQMRRVNSDQVIRDQVLHHALSAHRIHRHPQFPESVLEEDYIEPLELKHV